MKTLSIQNPDSYLVAYGAKDVDNRSWSTSYRGPLLIHSSGKPLFWPSIDFLPERLRKQSQGLHGICEEWPFQLRRYNYLCEDCLRYMGLESGVSDKDLKNRIVSGQCAAPLRSQALLGVVNLVDVVDNSRSPWAAPNHFHWVLRDARPFPLALFGIRGKLRLWDFDGPLPETVDLEEY